MVLSKTSSEIIQGANLKKNNNVFLLFIFYFKFQIPCDDCYLCN